jgi:hypothetical protein
MADGVHSSTGNLLQASDLALTLVLKQAPNSIRYTTFGDTKLSDPELDRIVQAVPAVVAAAMSGRAFYFVPLALAEGFSEARGDSHRSASDRTLVSPIYNAELSDEAICHRNVAVPSSGAEPAHEGIFISARLLRDTFALAFEYFINVGHAFATEVGIPEAFGTLAWQQAVADVRGETSQDAWESQARQIPARRKGEAGVHRKRVRGCDRDLPAVAGGRFRLLRAARAGVSSAGAVRARGTPAAGRAPVSSESGL